MHIRGERPRTHQKDIQQIHQAMTDLHIQEARERYQERHAQQRELARLRRQLRRSQQTIQQLTGGNGGR